MSIRKLTTKEITLAQGVFQNSVPYKRVFIADDLGPLPGMSHPYATETFPGVFCLHLGPKIYPDATLKKQYKRYGRYDEVFIHEMAHAWQYDKGYNVILSSLWANTLGSGYSYKPGKAWDDYNVEQQADIVSDWYAKHAMSTSDSRFVYIDKIIRPAVGKSGLLDQILIKLPADKLKKFSP